MSRTLLLRVAAFFTLFTFVGHTLGGLSGPPAEQVQAAQVYEQMKQTMEEMPFGSPKSLANIAFGANVCVSIFLLMSGFLFISLSLSKEKPTNQDQRTLILNSLGMIGAGIVSYFCFFPLPAICTALAGILGLATLRMK